VREVRRLYRAGRDAGVDYAAIDGDEALDAHPPVAAEADAEAEAAWFDEQSE
jgi:hypothetical protein